MQWSSAFECWLAQTSGLLDRHHISSSRLLKVHLLAGNTMLSVPEGAKETKFDPFWPLFQSVVSEVSHLVSLPPPSKSRTELGIIPALYLTGIKCHDPAVRRKAQLSREAEAPSVQADVMSSSKPPPAASRLNYAMAICLVIGNYL